MGILNEMKQISGLQLKESDVSQEKQMNSESRLIGAFGRLIADLRYIKQDCERRPHYGMGMGGMDHRTPTEKMEMHKTVDKDKLYQIAMTKLAIVEEEIKKTFEKGEKKIVVVKVEKDDDDDGEEEDD